MKSFNMAFPETLEETCELLEQNPESRVIAGGTAMTVVMKEGVYAPEKLINIRGLEAEHAYIKQDEGDSTDVIRIGALTTLREIERSDVVTTHLPVVVECLQEIAGIRVRNSATLGGHLAHADIHLDLPPVLAGYDAEVVITDGENERSVDLESFMRGYYETDLADNELISEVVLPVPEANTRGSYVKHRYFSEVDWPCVGVAAFAVSTDDGVENARVLLNSVSHSPILRLDGVDETLGGSLSDENISAVGELAVEQADPSDDLRGSAAYKQRMAGVFTERALRRLREE